ncbi:MAG: AAA family ATPase, partial [Clostridiales bacterium]|nr:AAA family ATPase [Clostridiales bacterium]
MLRNQTLEELHPGIVVIGGLNRAGKSTFMQVLRYLGYGFPQGRGLPPASSKYEAEADIRLDIGDIYNVRLSGHAQPALKRVSGTEKEIISTEELYGIDAFTYRQLFTITLDELNKNYNISNEEKRRLQSILLGAGFKDMLIAPQLEQDFYREGDKIGGKRGSPKVKQFKPYYNAIEKGLEIKGKALSQVDEYQQKQQELKEKKELSRQISNELEELQHQIVRLDVIKNNYKTYLKIQELEAWLQNHEDEGWEERPSEYDLERIKSLKEEYISLRSDFQQKEIELDINAQLRDLLLDKKDEMTSLVAGISGIDERIRQYTQQSQEYHRKQQQLITKVKETNATWNETNIKDIAKIKTDNISHSRLDDLVDKYKDIVFEHKNHRANLARMEEEYNIFQEQITGVSDKKPWGGVRKYFYSSLAFVLLGIVLTFISPLSGILLGIGGIAGTAVYYIMSFLNSREARATIETQKQHIDARKARIQAEEGIIRELENQLDNIKTKLDEYKEELGLSIDTPSSSLPGHLLRIRDIQEGIAELNIISSKIRADRKYLEEKYNIYARFIELFSEEHFYAEDEENCPIAERWDKVVSGLRLW